MQIKSLYLAHFGRFHRKSVELKPGINIIYGENEAGKSTIHHFISAMLFGVERLRGKASKKDEYSRFQPWEEGKNYEGSMEIRHNGQTYRLIRNFYREDEFFRIEHLETGKILNLPNQAIDGLVEGLNRSNFKNTLSISQLESVVDSSFGLSLQAYMANVQKTKNQAVDLGRTLDYLKKEKKSCQSLEQEKRLEQLQSQLDEGNAIGIEREELLEEIQKRRERLEAVREEIKLHNQTHKENRLREQKERMEAIRLFEENNYVAAQYQQKKAAYEKLKKQSEEDQFDALKEQWEEANEAYADMEDRYSQTFGRNLAILFSVFMFGFMPVLAVFFLSNQIKIRLITAGIWIAICMVCMMLLQGSRKRMKHRLDVLKESALDLQKQLEGLMFGNGQAMLVQLENELAALRVRYESLQEPLRPYIEKYGENISFELEEEEEDEDTLDFLRDKEARILQTLERLQVQKELMERRDLDKEEVEMEMTQLSLEVEERKNKADIIGECMQIIQSLSEEIHSDFGPALNREVSQLMWELTGGKYERVLVDNELNLKIDTGNGFVLAGQLSTGTKEQLYLALRVAMVNLFYPEKNMPLLFDDSFAYYDDKRLARMLSWLSKQGFDQIVIFSCQHREMDMMGRMGIQYHGIYL